jgi:hypothetical protein
MLAVGEKAPVPASYSSALEVHTLGQHALLLPPATRTIPFGSNVPVGPDIDADILPVAAKVPVAGT